MKNKTIQLLLLVVLLSGCSKEKLTLKEEYDPTSANFTPFVIHSKSELNWDPSVYLSSKNVDRVRISIHQDINGTPSENAIEEGHNIELGKGKYYLVLIDEEGNAVEVPFVVE